MVTVTNSIVRIPEFFSAVLSCRPTFTKIQVSGISPGTRPVFIVRGEFIAPRKIPVGILVRRSLLRARLYLFFPTPGILEVIIRKSAEPGPELPDDFRRERIRSYIAELQRPKYGGDVVWVMAGVYPQNGVCRPPENPFGNSGTTEPAASPVVPLFPHPRYFRGHNSEKCGTGTGITGRSLTGTNKVIYSRVTKAEIRWGCGLGHGDTGRGICLHPPDGCKE